MKSLLLHLAFPVIVLLLLHPKPLAAQDVTHLKVYLTENGMKPADYVIEKFKANSVILLGEDHGVQQNLLFVQSLIPVLYANHIYNIGMEFGASEDQSMLDALVTAQAYDEDIARKIMFHYNVAWAFQEYRDVYKKAWEFNRTLPQSARKFRIINLSYHYNWEGFEAPRTPENMATVFYKGTADKYRADLIEKEFFAKGEKILALVGTPHAYTQYANGQLLYNNDNFCSYDHN
ncbi:MAG: ChaN family lipoprotein [Chitinophagales bacterium]